MPEFVVKTNQGEFVINSNREPKPDDIAELIASGTLKATEQQPEQASPSFVDTLASYGRTAIDVLRDYTGLDMQPMNIKAREIPAPELAPPGMQAGIEVLGTRGVPSTIAESIGRSVGGPIVGPLVGAAGAMLGEGAEQLLHGEPFSPKKIGVAGALSIAPDVVGGVAQRMLQSTPGGSVLRREAGAQLAEALPKKAFEPASKQSIDAAFDAVRASGVKIDTTLVKDAAENLATPRLDYVREQLGRIDRRNGNGTLLALFDGMTATKKGSPRILGADVGELQNLRSELRKAAEDVASPEARDVLNTIREAVDTAIDSGLTRGKQHAGAVPLILRQARQDYARFRASEDLALLVEKTITTTPDGKFLQLNPKQLLDQLRRPATGGLAYDVQRSIERTPGAKDRLEQALEEVGSQFFTIETQSDTQGLRRNPIIAGVSQALSDLLLHPLGQKFFKRFVVETGGTARADAVRFFSRAITRQGLNQSTRLGGERGGETPPLNLPPLTIDSESLERLNR